MFVIELTFKIMWLFYVYLIECMLSQRINILHDVFQHICESLCNQQCIFLYQSIANRKTGGGPGEKGGGNGRGNSHDLKIFEKNGGEPGGTGPSIISILFCKKHQYNVTKKKLLHH